MPPVSDWVVHKFGGTSLADAARYRSVEGIILGSRRAGERRAVVVSAMSKVTDGLIDCVQRAARRDETYLEKLQDLATRHQRTLLELATSSVSSGTESPFAGWPSLGEELERDLEDLREVLRGIYLTRAHSDRAMDLISGHGEIWSARALAASLAAKGSRARWLDARQVLVVEPAGFGATIDWDVSKAKLDAWLVTQGRDVDELVITGFIAETPDGLATTLGRNGSDYSASIFGALLEAKEITIWTDVDGVLSADPRKVPEAVVLDELSYDEATELAYFGAKVVHPSTMAPAIRGGIPIWIRNTFNPTHPGTKIHQHAWQSSDGPAVKGFATIDDIALINVEGSGMMGVPGVAYRLFGALREAGLSVVMISQASSEHSICFALPESQSVRAKETVERAFFAELETGRIERVDVIEGCSVLAAVGDGMVERRGVAGRFFSALGNARVNVRAIAQGSSERNISAVIRKDEAVRALRAVHSGFFLSEHTLSIGVVGLGLIGGTLLSQLAAQGEKLRRESKIDLRVRAIANSRRMALAERRTGLDDWRAELEAGTSADLGRFADHVQAEHLPHAVIVDCTASEDVAALHPEWLGRGIHVVTANKKATAGSLELWRSIRAASKVRGAHHLDSTTVGAGLPIIRTLRELVHTGDSVLSIEGVLSGTLSYLFNSLAGGASRFSAIVADAKSRGYTEPDPRDDLGGLDVARKLMILAREIGLTTELEEMSVESLVPDELLSASVDEFMSKLGEFDDEWQKKVSNAGSAGDVLRYVAVIDAEGAAARARVEVRRYPTTHSFARLGGTDNIVAFRTRRYHQQPLVVQGPGAGPEVTAGGVFADLLRLSGLLGQAP
ncbi:MAG: bifunctional aspartate kinase/homoserine dehydrogenase I [Deltaproteobacteria bacterium]|nr:bifunctional aspartate kinase/homoserine dehydrogenase I [Deltaproteobacteria bacterium]